MQPWEREVKFVFEPIGPYDQHLHVTLVPVALSVQEYFYFPLRWDVSPPQYPLIHLSGKRHCRSTVSC